MDRTSKRAKYEKQLKAILDNSDDSNSDSKFSDDTDVETDVITVASGADADALPGTNFQHS